jgi:hypothetical protein
MLVKVILGFESNTSMMIDVFLIDKICVLCNLCCFLRLENNLILKLYL